MRHVIIHIVTGFICLGFVSAMAEPEAGQNQGAAATEQKTPEIAEQAVTPDSLYTKEYMVSLGQLAAQGQVEAINEIKLIAEELYEDIDYENEKLRVTRNLKLMTAAFKEIAKAAGEGSPEAMYALKLAKVDRFLSGFTADAFGIAAGMGNEESLDILINYGENGLLLASAVSALKYAADKNDYQAVDFLAGVIYDPKHKALWRMASIGLQGAALNGDEPAIQALEYYQQSLERKKAGG